jgi:Tol biopolymer transport system component
MSIVGGERRKIIGDASSADWSPDGRSIAFTRTGTAPDPMGALYVAKSDGSDPRRIASFPAMPISQPRWSPDGTRIAVVGSTGRAVNTVAIIDAGNGETRLLAAPPKSGEVSSVVWASDGESLFYSRGNSVEVVVGSTATIFRHDLETDLAVPIAWSPSNAAILDRAGPDHFVFDSRSATDNLREFFLAGGLDQSGRWLTRGNSSDRQPVYSPDGKSLVFSSNRSGNLDLWMLEPETGVVTRITDDAAEDWDPAFTQDGRIIWSSGRSGNLEIWIAERDGSNARQISKDGVDAENPTATADGRWIVYNSFNPARPGVWRVGADGSGTARIVEGRTALPEVSPDGQYVSYIANSRSPNATLRVARLSDGQDMGFEVKLSGGRRTSAILGRSRWLPGSSAIAFLAQDEEGINGVFVQDFVPGKDTTGTRRKLAAFDPHYSTESFGISPDGSKITVAGWEQMFGMMTVSGLQLAEE